MTRERAKELLPIITAHIRGKRLQRRYPSASLEWRDWPADCASPDFEADGWEWRIKPAEPRTTYGFMWSWKDMTLEEARRAAGGGSVVVKVTEILDETEAK